MWKKSFVLAWEIIVKYALLKSHYPCIFVFTSGIFVKYAMLKSHYLEANLLLQLFSNRGEQREKKKSNCFLSPTLLQPLPFWQYHHLPLIMNITPICGEKSHWINWFISTCKVIGINSGTRQLWIEKLVYKSKVFCNNLTHFTIYEHNVGNACYFAFLFCQILSCVETRNSC